MKFYQLAYCYLKRKKGKTLLLFMVLLIVNNMILGTGMILRATENSKKAIQEKTGSKVIAESNTEKNGIGKPEVNRLRKQKDVSRINCIGRAVVYPTGFVPITNRDSQEAENQTVALLTYSDLEKDSPFSERIYKLTEGAYIKENTRGIVLHADLAAMNGLKLGDTVEFCNREGEKAVVPIVGLFTSAGNTEKQQADQTTSVNRIENQMFVDNETYCELMKENPFYKTVVYTKNPKQIHHLEKEVARILGGEVTTTAADTLYRQISAPLEQISKAAKIMQILTLTTGTVVVSLLLCMWTRARKKEIAVFMSLGKPKREIVSQMLLEAFCVFALAVLGAAIFCKLCSGMLQRAVSGIEASGIALTVGVTGQDIRTLFVLGSVVVLIAVCCAVMPALKAKPRDILMKMEG